VGCNETVVGIKDKTTKIQRFTYITNVTQNQQNIVRTADSGRLRWKIENEGFNSQKNRGYELGHKFSRVSFIAMQNYYQLLQIAHIINQLVERSKQVVALLTEHSKQTIVDLWRKMTAYLIFSHAEQNILTPSLPD